MKLTNIWCDDGKGAEVGLPHILRQCVGVFLVAAQQRCRAALRVLYELPVWTRFWRQDGTAHADQILRGKSQKRSEAPLTGDIIQLI